ncbi:transglycosylase SLT domain-containing protein [Sphingosinicella sp. LHD-64]|uniref:transglycosylase SLT domain-containing protein n=1 Tax=Sphingosinicella sp. LHD-64 TaxID=3072139 RepID=UPI0028101CFF|nr:transglycosylase SLT domain-containing protein [Sphingosinicella sp. LHD-64]MDQ8757177.1 transglycosylase SLT domain-containing protein [Sphingosinicella sp. LHD-64]
MIPTTITGASGPQGRDRIGAAIQQAAARTGMDFGYLMNQARVESGLDPNARARTSSATGLFQFIDQTWLGTVQRHGADHGLGWAANAIRRTPGGRYHVADPGMRRAILDLRRQPEAASAMAAEFASDNRDHLESRIGRRAEPVDLYLAHFLGAGGAAQFLRAHDANPDGAAARLLPAAARANRSIFYDRDGSPKSFAEIRTHFARRFGDTPVAPPSAPTNDMLALRMALGSEEAVDAPEEINLARPSPEYARLAYLMLAQLGDA